MTFVIMRKVTLFDQITAAVKAGIIRQWITKDDIETIVRNVVQDEIAHLLRGDGTQDNRGLLGEFDSVHSRVNSLQMEIYRMQTALDDYKAAYSALAAKIDAFVARPNGLSPEQVAQMAADLRSLADKIPG